MAELLIEKGIDVNVAGQNGSTALMHAAGEGKKTRLNCIQICPLKQQL